jgi:endonuclease YncB( thermonuclease family)
MAQARGKSGAKRKTTRRAPARSGSSLWPWVAGLAAVVGGIALYDNSTAVRHFVTGLNSRMPAQIAGKSEPAKTETTKTETTRNDSGIEKIVPPKPLSGLVHRPVTPAPSIPPDQSKTAAIIPPAPIGRPVLEAMAKPAETPVIAPATGERLAGGYEAKFFLCGTAKQDDCVVSADRFVFHGQKIRLVGIEVPDIKKPHCEAERIKASDAELRVRAFLDSGPFELQTWQGNDSEIEGHKLRAVTRNGRSLADILVNEGLAKRPGSGKGWCS